MLICLFMSFFPLSHVRTMKYKVKHETLTKCIYNRKIKCSNLSFKIVFEATWLIKNVDLKKGICLLLKTQTKCHLVISLKKRAAVKVLERLKRSRFEAIFSHRNSQGDIQFLCFKSQGGLWGKMKRGPLSPRMGPQLVGLRLQDSLASVHTCAHTHPHLH